MEQSFIILKQDCLERKLIPQVLIRIQEKNLSIKNMIMIVPSLQDMRNHYIEHYNKNFYEDLCGRMVSGKIL